VVLSHEQLHFDISELFARKMRKIMAETRFTSNARAEVKAIYKKVLQDLSAFQSLYDHETNYSRDHQKQLAWNNKIKEALSTSESL
jgi:predicted secreted Zn-dependent protease